MDWPPPDDNPPAIEFHRVATIGDVDPGRPLLVRVGLKRVALFSYRGAVVALDNTCPHGGGNLGLGQVHGRVVVCPRHGWAFDVVTGACPDHEPYQARSYPVEIRGEDVFVGIEGRPELAGRTN